MQTGCGKGVIGRAITTVFAGFLLTGCVSHPVQPSGIPDLAGHSRVEVPDVDLLRLTPEMLEFAKQHAHYGGKLGGTAWTLAQATLDPRLLDFEYDPLITLPADEAFRVRKGNCLAYSSMYIAMARAAGIQAWFQEVHVPPQWSSVNDTLLVGKHVNVSVMDRTTPYTVDVSSRARETLEEARRLSDEEALAQYYNNLAVNALVFGDLPVAYAYVRKALEIDPHEAYLLSNLGIILKRNGQLEDAARAFETALQYDPDQPVPLNNLYTIYEARGDASAAEEIRNRVERHRLRNPYYLHHLAENLMEEQRYHEAIDLLEKAIRIEDEEYRFHYALAQSQFEVGLQQPARASLQRAIELVPDQQGTVPLTLPEGS